MKANKILLEILGKYEVNHIFGLPGETTLNWYDAWHDFPEIKHVLVRDERSAAFMADAYARVSGKVGVCEAPSVGSTHLLPGVAEAYKASVPMIAFTTDVPLLYEKKNMLTGLNQPSLYEDITKETITVSNASEIAFIVKRAFKIATSGKMGPVHIRLPMDVLKKEIDYSPTSIQSECIKYPAYRPVAETQQIKKAIELLAKSDKPVIICGQGVLLSQAWNEVTHVAEYFGIPVGTTITGKGSIPETHPLSIGVIGARGGTSFSNKIVKEADLLFYIGSNTDSATTDHWTLPSQLTEKDIINLNIHGPDIGNNYDVSVGLCGDAKTTLEALLKIAHTKAEDKTYKELPRVKKIKDKAKRYHTRIAEKMETDDEPIHPMRFIKELEETISQNNVIVTDPGVGAIYSSAFYKLKEAGRHILYNYALGALGYSIPASIGAFMARPDSCIVALTGDGSFGFTAGELETIQRIGGNINVILFNNGSFGWIRAATRFSHGKKYFNTDFNSLNYVKIAEGFGLKAYRVNKPQDLGSTLQKAFTLDAPTFIEIPVKPEDKIVPPVPSWIKKAKKQDINHIY